MAIFPDLQYFNDSISELPSSQNGWVCVYFDPHIPWPTRLQTLYYLDQEFCIVPHTLDALPAIAVQLLTGEKQDYQQKILRLSSVLSWKYHKGIQILGYQYSGHLICYQANNYFTRCLGSQFDGANLPEVNDTTCQLALALLRDARSLMYTQHPFAFLQFWKVLEATIGKGHIKAWICNNLDKINDDSIKKKIVDLRKSGIDNLSKHLFESGRCAIAHAESSPIINPDNPTESRRLSQELPIVESLAVLAIINKFEI